MGDGATCHYCRRAKCVCPVQKVLPGSCRDCKKPIRGRSWKMDGRQLCGDCMLRRMNAGGPEERIGDS